jgi:hypothetical protein
VSRGFSCTLFGIAMTIFSWFGPWEWPAWPAFTTIHLLFQSRGVVWTELPYGVRAAVLVGLIVINVGFWAAAAAAGVGLVRRYNRRSRPIEGSRA